MWQYFWPHTVYIIYIVKLQPWVDVWRCTELELLYSRRVSKFHIPYISQYQESKLKVRQCCIEFQISYLTIVKPNWSNIEKLTELMAFIKKRGYLKWYWNKLDLPVTAMSTFTYATHLVCRFFTYCCETYIMLRDCCYS